MFIMVETLVGSLPIMLLYVMLSIVRKPYIHTAPEIERGVFYNCHNEEDKKIHEEYETSAICSSSINRLCSYVNFYRDYYFSI